MKHIALLVTVAASVLAACDNPSATRAPEGGPPAPPSSTEGTAQYTCPMHPHYISTDADGSCPICGMDLVPVSGDGGNAGRGEILYYKHPMGQPDTSAVPKKDWMGMDYIPVYADEVAEPGIVVAPEMIQTMGVRTASAEVTALGGTLRAFGTVEANERLENVSVARLEGWIEDLAVRAEGDTVLPGALLYRVYSPDLIAAQKDLIASLTIGDEARTAAIRQRLLSLGMPEPAISRLVESREIMERAPVYAEAGGTVAALEIRDGDYVKPGTPVLRLQSYAGVWVMASIPETDLPRLDAGLPVQLSFPSAPEAPGEGVIDYIYPTIDPKTRTAQVRIEVDNAAGHLRPGAYADISMRLSSGALLSVPTEAILRDSRGAHVIVALGEGRFASRAVRVGVSANGRTQIVEGLTEGEEVVASGQFLLDSEVNLREGLAKLEAPSGPTAGPDTPLSELSVDAATLAQIDHFTDMALYLHEALTDRYRINPSFVDPALAVGEALRMRFVRTRLVPILEDAEAALRNSKTSPEGEALASELARLMEALEPWLLEGAPVHYRDAGLFLFRDTATGRLWLQEGETPRNPYGETEAEPIDWPNPMAEMPGMQP